MMILPVHFHKFLVSIFFYNEKAILIYKYLLHCGYGIAAPTVCALGTLTGIILLALYNNAVK